MVIFETKTMDVIALAGNPNIGKTTTLNVAYHLLLQQGYTQVLGEFIDLGDDFLDILELGNKKIGIITQGDYAIGSSSVGNRLSYLALKKCSKAICAQTLGVAKSKIATAIAAYPNNTVISKTVSPNIASQRIDNHIDANKIVALV